MNFLDFLDRQIGRIKWPAAREWLAIAMFAENIWIIQSIIQHPDLTKNEFFKLLAQGIVIQGFLTTVLAFFFTASKSSEKDRENLGSALGVAGAATTAARVATEAVAAAPTSPPEEAKP